MPWPMAARWVGQNSGSIFRRLRIKVHRMKFACVRASVCSLQRRFPIDDGCMSSRRSWKFFQSIIGL